MFLYTFMKNQQNEQTVLLSARVFQSWKPFQDCVTTTPICQVNSLPQKLFPLGLQVTRKGPSCSPPHHRVAGPPGAEKQLGGHLQDPQPKFTYTDPPRSIPTLLAAVLTPHSQPLKSTVWRRMESGSSRRRLTWIRPWHPELNSAFYHLLLGWFPLNCFWFLFLFLNTKGRGKNLTKLKLVKSLKNMANKMLTNQRQVISTQL